MVDTVLRLGEVEFSNMEIPERITLGGDQTLAVHKFVGGAKHVQALGADHAPISWTGLFLGSAALDRARYLDFLRTQGGKLQLTFFSQIYQVVILRFTFDAERFYKVPYSLVLEVVSDDTQPVTVLEPSGFDAAIGADLGSLSVLGDLIGDGPLSSAISSLDSAIRQVNAFASASTATIQSVLSPIAAVSLRASLLTASVRNAIGSVSTLGGVLPSNPLAASIGNMAAQVTAATHYPMLLNIQSLATRMQHNVTMANQQSSLRTLQVAGGTLFDVAAKEYGDATRWPAIAQASGLKDVILAGVNKLTIPARPVDSGGVPSL